eukprot:14319458-Alexandrium_andersonii.AAC.1
MEMLPQTRGACLVVKNCVSKQQLCFGVAPAPRGANVWEASAEANVSGPLRRNTMPPSPCICHAE